MNPTKSFRNSLSRSSSKSTSHSTTTGADWPLNRETVSAKSWPSVQRAFSFLSKVPVALRRAHLPMVSFESRWDFSLP